MFREFVKSDADFCSEWLSGGHRGLVVDGSEARRTALTLFMEGTCSKLSE